MRHRVRGRKLGRSPSHRKAMFRNMAGSLIRSVRVDDDDPHRPKVPGRIVTTLPKAKELRPFVEKLITLARRAAVHEERAQEFATSAERNTDEWKRWRESEQWNDWNQAIAPAVSLRRRAFAILRDNVALEILFDELAERFADRPGGYTRVVRLPQVRLGDAGRQALIEFVGERDRVRAARRTPTPVVADENDEQQPAADSSDEIEQSPAADHQPLDPEDSDAAADQHEGTGDDDQDKNDES